MTQLQKLEALATKYEEEARVIRRVIKILRKQNHVESEKNSPKVHWTQKPENKEKVLALTRKAAKTRKTNRHA